MQTGGRRKRRKRQNSKKKIALTEHKLKTVIIVTLSFFSFLTTDVLTKMVDAVYIPEPLIVVEGTDDKGAPVILEYEKKSNTLIKHSGNRENGEKKTDFDLFLKLFFTPGDHTAPDTMKKASEIIAGLLKAKGIKTENCIVSAIDDGGDPVISIGKEKRFSNSNELAVFKGSFLPSSLTVNEETIVFSEYHKSVLPASFPGRIEFYSNGNLIKTWMFYRKEHRQ